MQVLEKGSIPGDYSVTGMQVLDVHPSPYKKKKMCDPRREEMQLIQVLCNTEMFLYQGGG